MNVRACIGTAISGIRSFFRGLYGAKDPTPLPDDALLRRTDVASANTREILTKLLLSCPRLAHPTMFHQPSSGTVRAQWEFEQWDVSIVISASEAICVATDSATGRTRVATWLISDLKKDAARLVFWLTEVQLDSIRSFSVENRLSVMETMRKDTAMIGYIVDLHNAVRLHFGHANVVIRPSFGNDKALMAQIVLPKPTSHAEDDMRAFRDDVWRPYHRDAKNLVIGVKVFS